MTKLSTLLIAMIAASQACMAEDLAAVYQDALAGDPQYAAARAQMISVQERVPQSVATLLPSITASANTTWNSNSSNTYGDQSYNSHGYSVNLTQPLLRQQNNIAVDQSRRALDQAKAQLELARQDLIVRVSQAYFDVLLAQDSLATLKAQKEAIGEQLAAVRRKFEIGTASITDMRDTKARYDLVSAQVIVAFNELTAKRHALRALTNKEPGVLSTLRNGVKLTPPNPNNIDDWVNQAETVSQPVAAGQSALEIARLEMDKARAAHYPTLDLTATHGNSKSGTVNTVGTDLTSSTIGFQFAVPLYSGGGTVARQREVRALLDKAEAELNGAKRVGALAARQSFLQVTSGLAQVGALEDALESSRTALEANKRGLEVGVRVYIDVLNAQQQLSTTERDLAKARYDTLMALMRLKAAAGQLGEADVQTINGLLGS